MDGIPNHHIVGTRKPENLIGRRQPKNSTYDEQRGGMVGVKNSTFLVSKEDMSKPDCLVVFLTLKWMEF